MGFGACRIMDTVTTSNSSSIVNCDDILEDDGVNLLVLVVRGRDIIML